MKLHQDFKNFQDEEVNLNPTRLKTLDERVSAITNFLSTKDIFKELYVDVIRQGSFAHKTIIKPVNSTDDFDADVLLHLKMNPDWEQEPKKYVLELEKVFRDSAIYKEKTELGKRCVTIDYANDFHIDVVPYVERFGKHYIVHRTRNEFVLTDPETYNQWLDEKNTIANRNLVKVIRLIKYLRNYQGTFDVKSVVLNVLLGNQVSFASLLADPNSYTDVPTTLKNIMNKLAEYVCDNEILPTIEDPSGTGENFSDRWNQTAYSKFRTEVIRYAGYIDDAWADKEIESSRLKWQRVFGEKFGKQVAIKSFSESTVQQEFVPFGYVNTEQQLEDLNIEIRLNPNYIFRIQGFVERAGSRGAYYLSRRGSQVTPGRRIRFTFERCTIPEPYTIYWKVLNRGPEAVKGNMVRGQIVSGGKVLSETTSFPGAHYVECFIVKDGVCVARNRQSVNIMYTTFGIGS